jgi:hypothetical protein
MSGHAGRKALVQVTGDPVVMANEPCTDSGDHQIYQVTNAAKRVFDPTAAVTVKVGGAVTGESYTLNRLTGRITFAAINAGRAAVTVSTSYLPLSVAAGAKSYNYALVRTSVDDTDFDNANTNGGFPTRLPGVYDITGALGLRWRDVDQTMQTVLLAGGVVLIALFADRAQAASMLIWAVLSKRDLQMARDGAIEHNVDFQGSADADGRAASLATT